MARDSSKQFIRRIGFSALIFTGIGALYCFAAWSASNPWGTAAPYKIMHPLMIVFYFVGVVFLFFSSLALLTKKGREKRLALWTCSLLWIVVSLGAAEINSNLQAAAFRRMALRSATLVRAIRAYEAEKGGPPAELTDLVPAYYPANPKTGIPLYKDYEYQVGPVYKNNPWALWITIHEMPMHAEFYLYLPNQNYDDAVDAGNRRIGDWAHIRY